jgi:hypothetical protein
MEDVLNAITNTLFQLQRLHHPSENGKANPGGDSIPSV